MEESINIESNENLTKVSHNSSESDVSSRYKIIRKKDKDLVNPDFTFSINETSSSSRRNDYTTLKISSKMITSDLTTESLEEIERTSNSILSVIATESESLEIYKLLRYLKYPIFRIENQLKNWQKIREYYKDKKTRWLYYIRIDDRIYVFNISRKFEFEKVFEDVKAFFPILVSKYGLHVKQLSFNRARVF